MNQVREKFLKQNEGKIVKLFFNSGFQITGKILEHDEQNILFETTAYSSPPVLVSINSISTIVPSKK